MAKDGNGKGKGKASKASPSAKKAAAAETKETKLTVVASYPNPFPSFYANYASVSHTASEFFIDCAILALPYNVNLQDAQVLAPVIARIILPPGVATGLITALQAQVEKQKKTAKEGTLVLPKPKE
jgi:hypothetical protein